MPSFLKRDDSSAVMVSAQMRYEPEMKFRTCRNCIAMKPSQRNELKNKANEHESVLEIKKVNDAPYPSLPKSQMKFLRSVSTF